MIIHIVSWNLQDEAKENSQEILKKIKKDFDGLKGCVPGIISIDFIINEMLSSTVDGTLICKFENVDALNQYQKCDAHLKVAEYIRTVFCNRTCIDFEKR